MLTTINTSLQFMLNTEFAHLLLEGLLKLQRKIGTLLTAYLRYYVSVYIFNTRMKKVAPLINNEGFKHMLSRHVNEHSFKSVLCLKLNCRCGKETSSEVTKEYVLKDDSHDMRVHTVPMEDFFL